jgi:hypothetical protein
VIELHLSAEGLQKGGEFGKGGDGVKVAVQAFSQAERDMDIEARDFSVHRLLPPSIKSKQGPPLLSIMMLL